MKTIKFGMRRYFVELTSTILLTYAAMYGAIHADAIGDPLLRTLMTLSPIVPICLAAVAVYRGFRTMDEMLRQRLLNIIAISAAVTAVFGLSYPFMQRAFGWHDLHIIWTWGVMGGVWAVCGCALKLRDMVREQGGVKTGLIVTGLVLAVAVPTALYAAGAPSLGWPHGWVALLLVATFIGMVMNGFWIFSNRPWK